MIEQMRLDAMTECTRFETFAPFALAFFDSVVGSAFAPFASKSPTAEVARMRREMDAVLAPLTAAMRSSAMAA